MFKTLLLTIDTNDPDGSVRSTQAAVSMAEHKDATLHILNVVPDPGMAIVGASLASDHGTAIRKASMEALKLWSASHVPPRSIPDFML